VTQVMAHRGASRAERENTSEAFARAVAMGADAVELDVRRTNDGALVVHHNPHLPDGRVIGQLLVGELPDHVPTLSEALDACVGVWVNVEIKNDASEPDFDPTDRIADAVIAALLDRDENHRWLISSFRLETVDRCRALAPEIRTAWLCVDVPEGTIDRMVRRGHVAIHPWFAVVTEALVIEAHASGVQINTWTVDAPDDLRRLAEWGVDGVCTNVPDIALEVLGRG
jgi:glycerophosphoryl diester phosphodiesterase